VIQNLPDSGFSEQMEFKQRAAIVVMQNILQRGNPFTRPSEFLDLHLGRVNNPDDFLPLITPITKYFPVWLETIKGDDLNGYFPAKEFIETLWGEYLPQYVPLASLIEPEVPISNIIEKPNPKFKDQAVDFYLPHAKLVIEIDGSSHGDRLASANTSYAQKLLDDERDRYLAKHHIRTIRIPTFAIQRRNNNLQSKFQEIQSQIEHSAATDGGQIHKYLHLANNPQDFSSEENLRMIQLTTVFRIQILIIKAIKVGVLKFSNPTWQIAILDTSETQGQLWEIAVQDLNLWFAALFGILKVPFEPIEVKVESCSNLEELSQAPGDLRVDLNVFRRWTDENTLWRNIVIVRTDYDPSRDHFRVETLPQLVDYSIIDDGEDSDRPAFDFLLKNLFGFNDSFLDGQYPIIKNMLMRRNTIGILPTGGGKTLCYLFAAMLQPGISFVVSPLRSLMHDQRLNVQKLGIGRIEYMNSLQTTAEKDHVLQSFAQARYFLIWISPERFQQEKFREHINQLIGQKSVAYAVIDEVHCLSEWGHSFRVSYLTLVSTIRKYLPHVVLAGLTATASGNVLRDIKVEFDPLKTDVVIPPRFSRKNLEFQIRTPVDIQGKYDLLLSTLNHLDNKYQVLTPKGDDTKSSIIFAINKGSEKRNLWSVRTLVGELKRDLQTEKIGIFHGSLDEGTVASNEDSESLRQQEDFIENRHPVIVATKAFGMGINKTNIRYVFLYGIPVSLEELYQQAGRAGRDGQRSYCLLLYTKDLLPKELREELFALDCSIERMHAITKELHDCDLDKQLYLWLKNNRGIANEILLASFLYKQSIRVDRSVTLENGSHAEKHEVVIPYNLLERQLEEEKIWESDPYISFLYHLQKALYHLLLLGLIADWTVDYRTHTIKIELKPISENKIVTNLITYIRRYDVLFNLDQDIPRYQTYRDIWNKQNKSIIQRCLTILISWMYENIIYARRRALKSLLDVCDTFKNSDDFKRLIDEFFAVNDESALLGIVAEKPLEYEHWFTIFDTKPEWVGSTERLAGIKAVLNRLFESNRYNIGLNFISGLIMLILGDFHAVDGRDRMSQALADMKLYIPDITPFFVKMFESMKSYALDSTQNELLGEILIEHYPEQAELIYESLQDTSSLTLLLKSAASRIRSIGGSVEW